MHDPTAESRILLPLETFLQREHHKSAGGEAGSGGILKRVGYESSLENSGVSVAARFHRAGIFGCASLKPVRNRKGALPRP